MAINRKQILHEVQNEPLTKEELEAIDIAEKFIDSEIVKQIKTSNEIRIDACYPTFSYGPDRKALKFSFRKLPKMREELEVRYKKEGWKIRVEDDPDVWILY